MTAVGGDACARRQRGQAPIEVGDQRLALAPARRPRRPPCAPRRARRRGRAAAARPPRCARAAAAGRRCRHAERPGQHQIGIVAQHVLRGAVRDRDARAPSPGWPTRRVGGKERHGGDALALHQLDQQLVGAQVERDDAAWFGDAAAQARPPAPQLPAVPARSRQAEATARAEPVVARACPPLLCGSARARPALLLRPAAADTVRPAEGQLEPAKAAIGAASKPNTSW